MTKRTFYIILTCHINIFSPLRRHTTLPNILSDDVRNTETNRAFVIKSMHKIYSTTGTAISHKRTHKKWEIRGLK